MIKNSSTFSYATHTFYVSPQYQACSKPIERYYNSCNPQKKQKKKRPKIKYFCLFEIFNVFGFFFFLNKQNNLRNKTAKNKKLTYPQIIERIKSMTSKQHS